MDAPTVAAEACEVPTLAATGTTRGLETDWLLVAGGGGVSTDATVGAGVVVVPLAATVVAAGPASVDAVGGTVAGGASLLATVVVPALLLDVATGVFSAADVCAFSDVAALAVLIGGDATARMNCGVGIKRGASPGST